MTGPDFLTDVEEEAARARAMHGLFNSDHEAFAALLEKIEEIKARVWCKQVERDHAAMIRELIQIAAVAMKWAEQL